MTLEQPAGKPWPGLFVLVVILLGVAATPSVAGPIQGIGGGAAANPPASLALSGVGGQFAWAPDQPLAATVAAGPAAISHLVANIVLIDDSNGRRFAGANLKICPASSSGCPTPVTALAAGEVKKVVFVPALAGAPDPGKYSGQIELVSTEAKAPAIQTTVTVTSWFYKAWGTVALAAATLASFAFTLFVRNRLSKLQLEAPAGTLLDRFTAVDSALSQDGFKTSKASGSGMAIAFWQSTLSPAGLESAGLVPPWWSTNPAAQTNLPALQQLFDCAGAWAAALEHLEAFGFRPLQAAQQAHAAGLAATQVAGIINAARSALDQLVPAISRPSDPAPALTTLDADILSQLQNVQAQISGLLQAPQLAPALLGTGASTFGPAESLRYQIQVLSLASLTLAAVLTALVGSDVMVWTHPDFGRFNDFVLCILWGLGLPFTTSQLAQATPATIFGSLGVNLPRPA